MSVDDGQGGMEKLRRDIKLMLLREVMHMLQNQLASKKNEMLMIEEHLQTLRFAYHNLKVFKFEEHEI